MTRPVIYLASQSPRRSRLLRQLGIEFITLPVRIEEHWDAHESPPRYVERLALEKALAGWHQASRPLPVLGADTEVVCDARVLGKPSSPEEAVAMLGRLSGRAHQVHSAVAIVVPPGNRQEVLVNTTQVFFRALSDAERLRYVATNEPCGKAGGYAIQGLAAAFIERIEGSYTGVMGLPLFETAALLERAGIGSFPTPIRDPTTGSADGFD
ncbi:MAG: Maf family protein [Gammaproteobacteria bacterium]